MEDKKLQRRIKSILKYLAIVLATAAVTVVCVFYFSGALEDVRLKMLIEKYYVDDVDMTAVQETGRAAMVDALGDSHSFYIDSEAGMDMYTDSVMGEYNGIGVTIVQKPKQKYVSIVSVFTGSPAQEAGILSGDQILAVDGESMEHKTVDEVAAKVKGEEGTEVTLNIRRDKEKKTFTLVRQQVQADSVLYRKLSDTVGYARITNFDVDTDLELADAVQEMDGITSLIIDLRDNPGGLMQIALESLDLFIEDGVLLTARFKNDRMETYSATNDTLITIPVVVLINQNSASASEIFAACMQDHARATIVGETSYGKGSIQRMFSLSGNTGLNITIGRFYSPNGNQIDEKGVTPDVAVQLPEETKRKDIASLTAEEDTQLAAALELCK